jgi:hypothetical protein
LAFALARVARASSRNLRAFLVESAVAGGLALITIAPWVALVHANEGLPEYVQQRAALYQNWSVKSSPFRALGALNPVQALPSWDRLQHQGSSLPTEAHALTWLYHVTLLVPILLLVSVAIAVVRNRHRDEALDANTWRTLLAASILVLVDDQILRQSSYFVAVAPVTAAIGAQLLVWDNRVATATLGPRRLARAGVVWKGLRAALGVGIVLLTFLTSVAFTRIAREGLAVIEDVGPTFAGLLASPPIDGVIPAERLARVTRDTWRMWRRGDNDKQAVMFRYLHDCTAPGDRVLVTGSTPSQVNYLAERPFAGGHILWHHEWLADPVHESRSLAQLQQQSVPFAFSTHDPVLDDFKRYPKIRAYLVEHYTELEGSDGVLLIDTRRTLTGTFASLGFPCFR